MPIRRGCGKEESGEPRQSWQGRGEIRHGRPQQDEERNETTFSLSESVNN